MATKKRQLHIAEAVTGIIMVMIVLTVGLPRYLNWLQESKIGVATSQMHDDLQLAKNTAINNRHQVIVTFNATASGYVIHEDVNGNGAFDAGEPQIKTVLKSGIQYGTNSKLNVTDIWGHEPLGENPIALIGGGKNIIFNTQGQANRSGAVYLVPTDDADIRNDYLRAIQILGATGELRIMKYFAAASPPWH